MAVRGILTALFKLDTKQAEKSAAKMKRTLGQDLQGSLKRMGGSAGVAGSALSSLGIAGLGAAAGIGALGGAVAMGIRHVVQLGDQMTTLSEKTGLTTDFLQKLSHAATVLDAPFEAASKAISKMQVNIGKTTPTLEFIESLGKLGIKLEDLKRLDPEQQFLTIAEAIKAIRNPADQSAQAMGVFGRSGVQLLPAMKGDLRGVMEEAVELGIVLDRDLLEAGDELGESWETLTMVGKSLLAEALGPLVKTLADTSKAALENKEAVLDIAKTFLLDWNPAVIALKFSLMEVNAILGVFGDEAEETEGQTESLTDVMLGYESVVEDTAESQVKADIALAKHRAELAKVAKFVDKTTDELMSMDEAYIDAAEAAYKASEATKAAGKAAGEAAKGFQFLGEAIEPLEEFNFDGLFKESVSQSLETVRGIGDGFEDISGSLDVAVDGIGDLEGGTVDLEEAQKQYNAALAAANDLAQILGGKLGSIVGKSLAAGAALQNLTSGEGGIAGGIGAAFKSGKGDAGGLVGLLGGASSVLEKVGPFIDIGLQIGGAILGGLKKAFGKSDVVKDVARDMGANISQEMADSLRASGRPLELALGKIFQAGGFESIDRFAEEVGDLFAAFELGRISKPELLAELEETLPILIANFEDLGPAGEEQLERIIAAAERYGVELTELDQLMQKTFAPSTMEELAAAFGLSNDEVRRMADTLGIDVQTNLEKVAASVGLTAGEFKELGAALEQNLGIPAEQLAEFLEATGISASELAEKLGVDVGVGAGLAADAQAEANARLEEGGSFAGHIADQLERAARASHNINVPVGAGGNSGAPAARGAVTTGPQTRLIGEAGAEVVAPVAALFGTLGNDIARRVAGMTGAGGGADVVNAIRRLESSLPSTVGRAVRDNIAKAVG